MENSSMYELYHGNCLEILPGMPRVPCLFADPPDGIGLKYEGFDDNIPEEDYLDIMEEWLYCFVDIADTVWLSFNAKWTIDMGMIAARLRGGTPYLEIKPCVQTFSFGQHNQHDFGNNHRPLWRFRNRNALIYPDQIRIESERQKMGDKRANPQGKVPGDIFDFPRVTGNSRQRRKWHKTQLHEGLVERCIKSCTKQGDIVLDPFAGTGTTLRVCKRLNRACVTMDISHYYCQQIADEHHLEIRSA